MDRGTCVGGAGGILKYNICFCAIWKRIGKRWSLFLYCF